MKLMPVLTFVFLLFASFAFAEPHIAVREGLKCSVCHVNRTGGGKRTLMGSGYGAQNLPWKKVDLRSKNVPHFWWIKENILSIGGDFRFSNLTNFVEDNTQNTFQTEKADIYVEARLLPDVLSFYLDENVAGGAQAREMFGILHNLPHYGWVKAGKFVSPYGIRFEDDRAFIREVTGFNFNTSDIGAEIGLEPGNWSIVAAITNGTAGSLDSNSGKQVVSSVSYVHDRFRLGVSGAYNPADQITRKAGGLWGGLRLGKAALLGEVDLVQDETDSTKRKQLVSHAELNYWITAGWNLKAAYEFYDPNRDVAENQRDRVVLGVESFVAPFIHAAVFYRFNQSIPQNEGQNADEINFRVHIYF